LRRRKNRSSPSDIASIFSLVKKSVRERTDRSRAGLMLALADLPGRLRAYHTADSNLIVLNRRLIQDLAYFKASREQLRGYIFYALLHEYLHAIGYEDEDEVKTLVRDISRSKLGERHPATRIAKFGLRSVFPNLRLRYPKTRFDIPSTGEIEIIKTNDEDTPVYTV